MGDSPEDFWQRMRLGGRPQWGRPFGPAAFDYRGFPGSPVASASSPVSPAGAGLGSNAGFGGPASAPAAQILATIQALREQQMMEAAGASSPSSPPLSPLLAAMPAQGGGGSGADGGVGPETSSMPGRPGFGLEQLSPTFQLGSIIGQQLFGGPPTLSPLSGPPTDFGSWQGAPTAEQQAARDAAIAGAQAQPAEYGGPSFGGTVQGQQNEMESQNAEYGGGAGSSATGGEGNSADPTGGEGPAGLRRGGYIKPDKDKKLEAVSIMGHEGEYMLRPEATRYYGRGLLGAMNEMQIPKKKLRGLLP